MKWNLFLYFQQKRRTKKEEAKIDLENFFNKNILNLADFLKGGNSENL